MSWSTIEQMKARNAQLRWPALEREEQILNAKYAGQYVAYTDQWDDNYELIREVLVATPDLAEFQRLQSAIDPQVRYRVKSVAVPPAAPLPEPPPRPPSATLEQLRALNRKTPAQKEALKQADYALCGKYPGQEVAFQDTWNGDELTRTVLFATADGAEFSRRLNEFPLEVRWRLGYMQVPEPGVVECPSVWFE